VRGVLDKIPDTLDETYERVLRDINKANQEHARHLLQCLTVAVRPLRVEDLAEVLAVDFDTARTGGIPKLNPDWSWADRHHAVLSTCSSLIAVVDDGYSQVVQFSHFSVKEFLTSDRLARSSGDVSRYHILPSPAHTILAQACLGVLLRLDEHVTKYSTWDIPLATYAAKHWVDHAQFEDVSSHLRDVMEYFFDSDKPHWAAWLRVYDIDDRGSWSYNYPDGDTVTCGVLPIYHAALCGFYDLVECLIIKNPANVNAMGGQKMTPLVAALDQSHFQVAELLLRHGADVNDRRTQGVTPLHVASFSGRIAAVRWLLGHGVDVNASDVYGFVPLHFAAHEGYLEICRILLEHNAEINVPEKRGMVPLHLAATVDDSDDLLNIVQLLLDHGADVNARDDDGCTPLHFSSWWEKEGITRRGTVEGARLLLTRGANIDAENNEGKTPLQVALEAERYEMANFLSGQGAR